MASRSQPHDRDPRDHDPDRTLPDRDRDRDNDHERDRGSDHDHERDHERDHDHERDSDHDRDHNHDRTPPENCIATLGPDSSRHSRAAISRPASSSQSAATRTSTGDWTGNGTRNITPLL
jgi:ABC-type Zn2+ transport system substrate-binding protein/surface adhesin